MEYSIEQMIPIICSTSISGEIENPEEEEEEEEEIIPRKRECPVGGLKRQSPKVRCS